MIENREPIAGDIGIETHCQRTAIETGWAVGIGHTDCAADKLQCCRISFGISAAEGRGAHNWRVIITNDGDTQRGTQYNATGTAIINRIGQCAAHGWGIAGIPERQIINDALGNRGGGTGVERNHEIARGTTSSRSDNDPV